MLLVKEPFQLKLNSTQRVIRVITHNTQEITIINPQNITTYHLYKLLPVFDVKTVAEDGNIVDGYFHEEKEQYYCLVKVGQNYLLIAIGQSVEIIYTCADNPAKYPVSRELQPRILQLQREYIGLVRKFYNDSLVVVFRDNKPTQEFYLQEDCLSPFDTMVLVNYRMLFRYRLEVALIDISKEVKSEPMDRIDYEGRGVVMHVGKVEPSVMLIVINRKVGNIGYLLYDYQSRHIKKQFEQNQASVLMSLTLSHHNYFSVKCQKYKQPVLSIDTMTNHNLDRQPIQLNYEEWAKSNTQTEPLITNYTQNENYIEGNMYLLTSKTSQYVYLLSKVIEQPTDTFLQTIVRILN